MIEARTYPSELFTGNIVSNLETFLHCAARGFLRDPPSFHTYIFCRRDPYTHQKGCFLMHLIGTYEKLTEAMVEYGEARAVAVVDTLPLLQDGFIAVTLETDEEIRFWKAPLQKGHLGPFVAPIPEVVFSS